MTAECRAQNQLTMTDGELRLMRVLWDKGEATVGEVVDALKTRPKPAYNTVLTLLRIMEKKGYVSHRKDGRAFIFLPQGRPCRCEPQRDADARQPFLRWIAAPAHVESARGCATVSRSVETAEGAHRGGRDDGMAADVVVAGQCACRWCGGGAAMCAAA